MSHKVSNALWERFRAACDAFFDAKEKAVGNEKAEEKNNMDLKQAVIDKLAALKGAEGVVPQQIRELMAEWNQIGHVPFKEKDRLYNAYKELVDYFFDNLDMKGQKRRAENIRERVSKMAENGGNTLQRKLERLQADLKTYENNLGFLSSKSKGGNGMVALMQNKMNDLKIEIEELKKKIAEDK